MSKQKYYPLQRLEVMKNTAGYESVTEGKLNELKEEGFAPEDATAEDFCDYIYGIEFFTPEYNGPFKKYNAMMMYDINANHAICPNFKMEDFKGRETEWKDMFVSTLLLEEWEKSKMVYKIDNDFFHEIKKTENLVMTKEMFEKLPYSTLFIDLMDVKDISDMRGVWVKVYKDKKHDAYGVNFIMCKGENPVLLFSHYSWAIFKSEGEEAAVEVKMEDSLSNSSEFVLRNLGLDDPEYDEEEVPYIKLSDEDVRCEIVMACLQILQFISLDASDINENPTTKQTYRPSSTVKNKFSEVRMWDVGVRYGKAIHAAKSEYRKHIQRERSETGERKDRKPTRPHVRRAHWHRFKTGKGRTETTTHWIAPVYVCGNGQEIPVTIHEIKK